MSDRIFVGTRKGLFTVKRSAGGWGVVQADFLGVPVSYVLSDSRDGRIYAAVGHEHFGVKLHRSTDGGKTWEEVAAPQFPEKTERDALRWRLGPGSPHRDRIGRRF